MSSSTIGTEGSTRTVIKPRRNKPMKHGSKLWLAVRKSVPAFVSRPLRERFRRQHAPPFMIDPEVRPKLAWDGVITCCVLYTTCVVPYRVCFKRDASGGFALFETSLDLFFFVDIVLNFVTGIHLPTGEVTYEFRVVATTYLRGWFFVDFFSTLPFEDLSHWFGSSPPVDGTKASAALASAKLLRSLKILRLFKLARIRKLNKMFLSLEEAVYTNQSLLSLTKLALTMLFLSHLVACLWFAIGNHGDDVTDKNTWVYWYSFDSEQPALQYLVSVYWAIVTMVTIGYGDILARNNNERLFTIMIMAIGVSFFGYVVGTISTLVSNLNVSAALYDERLTTVKEYIISRQIPTHLSKRIRDHFEYYYQNRSVFKEKKILGRLPSAMRNEMIHHIHTKIVTNVKYFTHCHESLISDIVMNMNPFSVLKDEYVYVQHEIAAHVFFLLKGKVYLTKTPSSTATAANSSSGVKGVSKPGAELRLATLTVGEHFGELEVYDHEHGNGVRICSAVARSYCELTFLSRQAISKISATWPEVLRHFKDTAKENSKRMRRRVDKTPGRRHGGGGGSDCSDHENDDEENEDGLFRDDEMENHMIKSTLLAHKTMRATAKKPTGKVSPFVNHDSIPSSSVHHEQPWSLEKVTKEEQHIGEVLPATDDVVAVASASPLLSSVPVSQRKATRGRVILEALRTIPTDKPSSTNDVLQSFTDVERTDEATASIKSSGTPHKSAERYQDTKGDHGDEDEDDDEEDDEDRASASGSPGVSVLEHVPNDDRDRGLPNEDPGVPKYEPTSHEPGQTHPRKSVATIARLHPLVKPSIKAATSRLEAKKKPGWKALASTAVGEIKRDQESRRNLNDILAKIRTSPASRPKPNFHSEQLLLKGTYVFHPQEPFILTWQLVVGIGILYSIIIVPYRLGFDAEALGAWYILESIIDGFFAIDMLINFRTAYFDEERLLIYDTRIIFWRYMKGWFLLDLMSTVPIDEMAKVFLEVNSSSDQRQAINFFPTKLLRLFRIARLLKLARLVKLSRVAGRLRDFVQLSPSTERLSKLMLVMSLFCHWNACAFHAAMLASESSDFPNWCTDFFPDFSGDLVPSACSDRVSRHDRYIAAIYWAFTTFTTVGYGDLKPSMYSTFELALVILLVVINSTVYGYIISAVVTLIKNLDPSDREYKLRMTEMKDYLRDSSVSLRVGANIKAHYTHTLMSTSLFPEEKIFDKMSPSLRFDIARLVAGETLFAIPLITVMEDSFKGFVSYALFLMKPLCILRTEKVCRSGGPGMEMFFLVEGECELVNSDTGEGCTIGRNAVFEQYSLMARSDEIYRTVSTVTAMSKKAILYSLAIQDFKVLEDVSPAVSTYFLSQLAAVLIEDDLFTLTSTQQENVECALRNGRVFRAVAEKHEKARLSNVGNVAIAKLLAPRRRGSEWAPDLLPRLLNRIEGNLPITASHTAAPVVHLGQPEHPNGVPESWSDEM